MLFESLACKEEIPPFRRFSWHQMPTALAREAMALKVFPTSLSFSRYLTILFGTLGGIL